MQITIVQAEIEQAIIAHVGGTGVDTAGKDIEVSMKAGRKGNGYTATIDISPSTTQLTEVLEEVVEPKEIFGS